jgi:uncharacterized membrane protein
MEKAHPLRCGPVSAGLTIRLAPHCALSTRGALYFYASACAPPCGVAGLMALRGWWPVLPFAGLEMLLLGAVLWHSLRRRDRGEVITVTDELIEINSQVARKQSIVFPRHWAQVKLRRAASPLHPSRLLIMSHGRSFEVGSFLTEEVRRELAGRLRRAVGNVNESPPLAG